MKNFLIYDASWQRIAARLDSLSGVQPVLFGSDGSLSLNGERVESVPIHAAWLNFDMDLDRFRRFADLLQRAESLEFVQTAAAGLDSPLFKALAHKPIRLCNSDAQAPAIAEYVVASLLNRLHRFDLRSERQRARQWTRHEFRELGGCHCVLVGYGFIGSRIANLLGAFGASVVVVRRQSGALPQVSRVATIDDLPELLPQADIVILANALNDATRDLVDADLLRTFKAGSILVNIARGALIDEVALLDALNSGRLDYAILDVFRDEPLPDSHPFWTHDRVAVTAHTASAGSERPARGDDLLIENLTSYLTGRALRNEVDLQSIRRG